MTDYFDLKKKNKIIYSCEITICTLVSSFCHLSALF